jgi:hypothetical protein
VCGWVGCGSLLGVSILSISQQALAGSGLLGGPNCIGAAVAGLAGLAAAASAGFGSRVAAQ